MIKYFLVAFSLASSLVVTAQIDTTTTRLEKVTVTSASKFEQDRKDSGKPVIKITQADIEKQSASSLADLLNQYAGIEINGARSNTGQNLSYFIRGGNNRQVSFLIDGAQVNDPSLIASDFDLRLVDLGQIEEIEILKGASSTLYGANASTAVINIKLKEAARKKLRISVGSFVGTNSSAEDQEFSPDEITNSINASGRLNNGLTYAAGFHHQYTYGLSAVEPLDGSDARADKFNRVNGLGRIGYDNQNNFKLTSYVSFDEYKAEFDNFDFTDADNETYSRQIRWGTNAEYNYSDKGSIVYNDVSTHTRRDTRSGSPTIFNADGYSLDLYNKYAFNLSADGAHELKTILGFNFRTDSFESESVPFDGTNFEETANEDDTNFQIYDPYVNVVYESSFGLNLNTGIRYNIHSDYDSEFVYSVNPSVDFDLEESVLKVYGSYSTAYITPSLYQLFDRSFNLGNPDLQPETNTTREVGAEWFMNKTSLTVSVFDRRSENEVIFISDPVTFAGSYANADINTQVFGFEASLKTSINERIDVQANYSFADRTDDLVISRVPKQKVNASIRSLVMDRTYVTLRYQYNDPRQDAFFNNTTFVTESVTLDAYQLVDIDATYKLKNKDLTFFAGVSNLFNEDFTELYGFQTRGRNYKLGLRVNL
ncbi:vitamin B12 transporter [Nonlabens sp. Hel1_33_55]|uniref:TonB-dependent receptor plug domain-containing protein n=1 Tax=Nonlabens sp. Hel1_33_55 TaxID=1336802 RepID=UPI000875DE2C|nr:TonB-dependent receptor [Nonlabens sp. Hel1_33_55]SCY12008.1 vitamin B12 transporter [Nonlabens sp. Hel1_33_55]